MSMKNSSETIGNRTRDLPACSAVHQPTAPPRGPKICRERERRHCYIVTDRTSVMSVFRRDVNVISLFWDLTQRRLFSRSLAIEDGA